MQTADLLIHNHNSYRYINIDKNFKSNIYKESYSLLNICDKADTVVYDETWSSDHFPVSFYKEDKNYYEKKAFNLKLNCTD